MANSATGSLVPVATLPENPMPGLGDLRTAFGKITITTGSTYPSGGYALTPAHFGLAQQIVWVDTAPHPEGNADRYYSFNATTGKVMVFVSSTGAELGAVDNGSDVVAVEVKGY